MRPSAVARDRARGVLVGLAVGDALGAPVEFDSPESIAPRREWLFGMPGGGAFGWAPGEFTDDTQMALVLARHLVERGGTVEPVALARAFAAWAEGAADVGVQTRRVLDAVRGGADWRQATSLVAPDSEPNGSLMRVAPVALAAGSRPSSAALARAQSEVTHPTAACLDACAVFASALWDAIDGDLPSLEALAGRATVPSVGEAVRAASGAPPKMSGWVIATMHGALWAVYGADGFADAIWRAVALGEDADTVGAVAGALAGAHWGLDAIPTTLASRLVSRHPLFRDDYPGALVALADRLLEMRAG
jgi:ADP-ribosyl-[dinitrogen reductase] hydrolase